MPGWSIVVPMYRESARIAGTVARLAASDLAREDNEFLFVDDGSPDDTVRAVTSALAGTTLDARVLCLPRNLGKGAAVRTGVLAARHPVVVFVDADLSSPPSAIVEVCRAVENGAQVAVASRAHATSTLVVRQPAAREGAGKTFNRLLRRLGLTSLPDTQCGLKAFDADAARALFRPLQTLRFAFDVEVLLRAGRLGMRIEVLPTEWAHVEASRVSPVRDGGRMAWDALRLAWSVRARQRDGDGTTAASPGRVGWRTEAAERDWLRAALADVPGRGLAVDVASSSRGALAGAGFSRIQTTPALSLPDGEADAVCALGVLAHLPDDFAAVADWGRALAPDGRLLLTGSARRQLGGGSGADGRARRYRRAELEQVAAAAGLDVLGVHPLRPGPLHRLHLRRGAVLCLVARRPS
jgi:SAM-dependent methyltransferase